MATVEENVHFWDQVYDWENSGEEWSRGWGGSHWEWTCCIYPRVRHFLPATSALEIAPGYGRWTHYLKDQSQFLIGVDLSQRCVGACRKRFPEERLRFFRNDGVSLDQVEDASVDFVFSFFSLIHAEVDVITGYLEQIAQKLKPGGAGFIHHSNLHEYSRYFEGVAKLPKSLAVGLNRLGLIDLPQWRAPSMSATRFQKACRTAGLICTTQELVNFGSRRLIDCFSTFVRPPHPLARETRIWRNEGFMHQAMRVRLGVEQSGKAVCSSVLPKDYYPASEDLSSKISL